MFKKTKDSEFGFNAIFKGYTLYDFICDALFPAILGIALIITCTVTKADSLNIILTTTDLSINILPAILGLIVAGYTILVSFYWSDTAVKVKSLNKGSALLKSMNSDFALVILFIILSLLYSIVLKIIISLEISFVYHDIVNYASLFALLFLLFFSLKILKDVVVDTYNIGQLSIKLTDKNK
ncbi:hypothetical protein LDB17_13850 [Dysgonomonas sp. Shenzhen-Wh21]|uniref:hypothetical protein n=1 Tax=Dysgonomonas TaxID=156973 RepID=UPI00208FBA0A|nr:hypothetical protein [Dysgonomonas mossii]